MTISVIVKTLQKYCQNNNISSSEKTRLKLPSRFYKIVQLYKNCQVTYLYAMFLQISYSAEIPKKNYLKMVDTCQSYERRQSGNFLRHRVDYTRLTQTASDGGVRCKKQDNVRANTESVQWTMK